MSSDQASFERLIEIGIALSAEKDTNKLMETILLEAKDIGNADGGTLYIRTKEDTLKFEILRNDSLGIAQGGTTGEEINIPPQLMYVEDGVPNTSQIVSYAALFGKTLNIADAYDSTEFDFSGTKKFDEGTGYRTTSVLTVPLKNSVDDVIGVLQLLNAQDPDSGQVIAFSGDIQPLIEALASQAAVALDNAILIEAQENLLDSFITLMARAVDAKSPYTGGHCERVPELTEMLTKAACESVEQPFSEFSLNEEEWYELHIGAWLHDCGKVTTPEYVVDKSTKLETITDRIHEIRMRFEVVKREAVIACQEKIIAGEGEVDTLRAELDATLAQIDDDFNFIAECNLGGEFMADDLVERVKQIAGISWNRTLSDRAGIAHEELRRKEREPEKDLPCVEPLLSDRIDHVIEHDAVVHSADPDNPYGFKIDVPENKYNLGEIYNLCISRGTLTNEERFKINDHIVQTIVMLESLPFPKHLERVPEIAGGHHEKMDGTGYPKKLDGKQMSIPARVMAIADVFEALTAADRPYKSPKKLSDSIKIMSFMVKDQHLDSELFKLFLTSGVYQDYADKYLLPSQVDEVDVSAYLGSE
ncbi:MAG: GAF domain-containing protein [Gammaproteobacteria bacterium]|jgi:HD-GYP domain-containing protein (c-di-GMP phosphodiesterase class II)|nr:GAF domain-containing protein [Gammaproteobacteria bacterium]MBT4494429.1 GAF domain-containing protein [Gammaproteobacteria bacterium]MBT7372067.1 GAF domain-containing protein [Gammaproteobacteria bacterium]